MLSVNGEDRKGKVNKLIWRIFTKKHGITLQQDAVEFLLERLTLSDESGIGMEDVQRTIEFVADQFVRQHSGGDALVGRERLQAIIDGVMRTAMHAQEEWAGLDVHDYIHVVDAFQVAHWQYDPHQKHFVK